MRRWIAFAALVVVALAMGPTTSADAAGCTRGSTCLCDCLAGPDSGNGFRNATCQAKNYPVTTSKLLCEDFEAPTLRSNVNVGGGAPDFGPPYDNSNQPVGGYRGYWGYWNQTYGPPHFCLSWQSGQPPNPQTLGVQCTAGTCGYPVWHPTNLWGSNNTGGGACTGGAIIAPMTSASDFTAEIATITVPTNTSDGSPGVFDGNASMGWRIPAGNHSDIAGSKSFGSVQRNFGYTGMHAYASNLGTVGLLRSSWKHHEWDGPGVRAIGSGGDGLVMFFNRGNAPPAIDPLFPFLHFIFFGAGGETQSSCQTKANAATKTVGTIFCDTTATEHRPVAGTGPGQYDQATHWPLATWACVRATFTNWGLTNSGVTMTVTTPQTGNTERTIIQISNWDLSATDMGGGVDGLAWDTYVNTNDHAIDPSSILTSATTWRYDDNIIIKSGAPLTCAQIGYTGATSSGPTNTSILPNTASTVLASTAAISRVVGNVVPTRSAIRGSLAYVLTATILILTVLVIRATLKRRVTK